MKGKERGVHKIKRSGETASEGTEYALPTDSRDSWFGGYIFIVFILLLTLGQCAGQSGKVIEPKPPVAQKAIFKSHSPNASINDIKVVLGGGSYEISYESHAFPNYLELKSVDTKNIFLADFNTGKTSGDSLEATTYVLIGDLSLQISNIDLSDSLDSLFVQSGKNIAAYFNYANSERGPPVGSSKKPRRRVIIVGTLTEITFPGLKGRSKLHANIMDLEPGEDVWRAYEVAKRQFEYEKSKSIDSSGSPKRRAVAH